jgi:hypothetical protein
LFLVLVAVLLALGVETRQRTLEEVQAPLDPVDDMAGQTKLHIGGM